MAPYGPPASRGDGDSRVRRPLHNPQMECERVALTPALSQGERGLDSRFRGNDELCNGLRKRETILRGFPTWSGEAGGNFLVVQGV